MTPPALAPAPAPTPVYAAARSRAHGPTIPLWHAVELHRPVPETGACELTLCGSLVRIVSNVAWSTPARDVCRVCVRLAR